MSTAIDEIVKSLEECKKEYPAIDTEKFLEYVYAVKDEEENKDSDHQNQLEQTRYQAECELHKECYRAQCENNLEMFRSVISSGQNALKTGLLLNGGAAIAILAFLGNIAKSHQPLIKPLSSSLLCFGIGALLVGLSCLGTYITQLFYGTSKKPKDKWNKNGTFAHLATILVGLGAIFCFVYGIIKVYSCLKNC